MSTRVVAIAFLWCLATGCEPGYLDTGRTAPGRGGTGEDDPPPSLRLMDGGPGGSVDPGPDPFQPGDDAGTPSGGGSMEPPPPPPPPPPGPPMATGYPSGPYGLDNGDTVDDLSFTDNDGHPMTMRSMRSDVTVKVIVWISSVEWCGSCRDAVPELNDLQNRYGPQGMLMIQSLYEDYDYSPATTATTRRWTSELGPNYPMVVEPEPAYSYHANPATWVIDAETMRVLDYSEGVSSEFESTIADAIRRSSR